MAYCRRLRCFCHQYCSSTVSCSSISHLQKPTFELNPANQTKMLSPMSRVMDGATKNKIEDAHRSCKKA